MGKNQGELPFDPSGMTPGGLVIDMAYSAETTALIALARTLGIAAFSGRHMLVAQVREQFRLMTKMEMPVELANEMAGVEQSTKGQPIAYEQHDSASKSLKKVG